MRATLEATLGRPLSNQQWAQASLSLKRGGLGLRNGANHAAAAYLSSRTSCFALCCQLDSEYKLDIGSEDALTVAYQMHNSVVQTSHHLSVPPQEEVVPLLQKALASHVEEETRRALLANAETVHKARLLAVSAPHAGAWLNATPAKGLDNRLSHAELIAAAGLRLGVTF